MYGSAGRVSAAALVSLELSSGHLDISSTHWEASGTLSETSLVCHQRPTERISTSKHQQQHQHKLLSLQPPAVTAAIDRHVCTAAPPQQTATSQRGSTFTPGSPDLRPTPSHTSLECINAQPAAAYAQHSPWELPAAVSLPAQVPHCNPHSSALQQPGATSSRGFLVGHGVVVP